MKEKNKWRTVKANMGSLMIPFLRSGYLDLCKPIFDLSSWDRSGERIVLGRPLVAQLLHSSVCTDMCKSQVCTSQCALSNLNTESALCQSSVALCKSAKACVVLWVSYPRVSTQRLGCSQVCMQNYPLLHLTDYVGLFIRAYIMILHDAYLQYLIGLLCIVCCILLILMISCVEINFTL